ncbi:GrpB family protein [Chlorogloeopsis fritschii PCC 9212]|nr:GrpB family protein [Chlorogloeopsis fritschii]
MFAEEAVRLRQVLSDDLIVKIEHIDSTAVSGLATKP